MANNFIRLAAVSLALLLMVATAAADPFLDAAGPPVTNGSATSTFEGDLDDLTGTLILDDMIVTALEHRDGSTENLSTGTDAILGADVYFEANFEDGALTGTGNLLKISEGTTTYFEEDLRVASLSLVTLGSTFRMLFTFGSTETDPVVATGVSDWIDDLYDGLEDHGLAFYFSAHVTKEDPKNEDLYYLNNADGKMTPNPEPASLLLIGAVLAGGLFVRRRFKRT